MSWDDRPPIPEAKRRVVFNIPRDIHWKLKDLWFDYRNPAWPRAGSGSRSGSFDG